MSSQLLRFNLIFGLVLAAFLGNSGAWAGNDKNDGIVVPTSGSPTGVPSSTRPTSDPNARFSCQSYQGKYTVMYQPKSQPGKYYPWAAPATLGGGWDPFKRCDAIASRLELYRPDGLQELQTAIENNQNIICVTTQSNSSCRIVLTVPPGKDPITVRNSVFQNLTTADNGQQTTAVDTYTSNSGGLENLYNVGRSILSGQKNQVSSSRSGINLKPYLDPQDGGNASNLHNGVSISRPTKQKPGVRLNPGLFR